MAGQPRIFATALAVFVVASSATSGFEATQVEIDAFLGADTNEDLVLDRNEFKTFVLAMAKSGHKSSKTVRAFGAYTYAFDVTDANRDGVVTPQELRTADDDFQASNAD